MHLRLTLLLLTAFASCIAAASAAPLGNLILNGGFENGIQFWSGDGKVVTLPDAGKVFELSASKSRMKDLSQDFRMRDLNQVEVLFRARSINYKGPGLRISVHVPRGGSMLFNKRLPDDGSWTDVRIEYTRTTANEDRRTLIISTLLGTGEVQIDNVEVREPSTVVAEKTAKPEPPAKSVIPPAPPSTTVMTKPVTGPATTKPAAAPGSAIGSFPPQYRAMAEELMKTVWDWKASGGNFTGASVFDADGEVRGHPSPQSNGDWRIGEDGTLIYRRGDDRALIWHLKRVDADRYEGLGVGGAARERTCGLTKKSAR